ncbi:MAG: UNC-50 family protein [Aureobasidium pullulans]|nr:MAG: UNC-50 family protein [Aureobasidium pullulans]
MSSPSLPSLSDIQPVTRPRGFVTARSVLADLESQGNHDSEPPEAIAPPEKPKRGRPKKAASPDDAVPKPRARKKTTVNETLDIGDVYQVAAKPKARKRQPATTDVQEGALEAPPAPKRGRPKKAPAVEDAATFATTAADTLAMTKPVAKRARKKSTDALDASVEKPKPPPKPRKTKAPAKTMPIVNDPATASEVPTLPIAEVGESVAQPHVQPEALHEGLDLEPAPRRRRDWTPPTESALPPSFQQSSDNSPVPEPGPAGPQVDEDDAVEAPASLDFTKLMGDFGYQENNPRPPPPLSRNSSDGATTKRKRLDSVDVAAPEAPKKRKKKETEPKEPKPKPPKKPKAPKKKPLTITALATAAYLPQPANATEDQTKLISDFFPQPPAGPVAPPDAETAVVATAGTTTKGKAAGDKPAPKRKRAKKVQITVPEVHIKLDSPEAARENMRSQQWLFGSSSQLAAAESPTELRDFQQALKESEEMIASQHLNISHETSCAHVPSAPHGTSLSIGQANRVLWMSAARDFEDSAFISDDSPKINEMEPVGDELQLPEHLVSSIKPTDPKINEMEPVGDELQLPEHLVSSIKPTSELCQTQETKLPIEVLTISSSAPKQVESPNSGFVDIDQLAGASPRASSVAERPRPETPSLELTAKRAATVVPTSHSIISLDTTPETEVVPRRALGARDPNTNMTRTMVDPESNESVLSPKKPTAKPPVVCLDSPDKKPRGRLRKVTSSAVPEKSSGMIRRVVDASPTTREDARRQYLVAAHSTPTFLPPSQQVLRERLSSPSPLSSSKPRGRPPKFGPAPKLVSPARPRGRPRKSPSPSALPISSQLCKAPPVTGGSSQRATIVEPSSDYLDIDAISDVEMASHFPSPPRRLPNSPPKAILEFDRPPPPPLPTAVASAARCSAKQLQAEWPVIAVTLFPRITQTVRSTPPSRDHKAPTWHEKILLYDPIVLEDLTSWLNGRGVRIEVTVPKGKAKKKAGETEETMETVHEVLQPWMVQKWCEEHSVCCLWREGLRGGVRQKY